MVRSIYVPEAGRAIDFPDEATDDQIIGYLRTKYAPKPPAAPPEEPIGAVESGLYGLRSKVQTAVGRTAQAAGLESYSQYLLNEARANQERAAKYQPEISDISQISGPGDVASFAGSTIGQSLPESAVGIGGAYAGAVAGGSIGAAAAGVGAIPGAIIGGLIGGAIASIPSFVGGNLQAQAREQGIPLEETDLQAASTTALAQAPIDAVFEVMIARKLPGAGAALDVVRGSFLKEIGKNAAIGAGVEGLTEPAQQALELAQANPEKLREFGPEVQLELLNAAAAGALAGGTIGGIGGAISAVTGPKESQEQKLAKTDLAGEVVAGRKRTEELVRFGEINSGVEALASQPTIGKLKLRKITIEPTKENKLVSPIDRFQVTDYKGGRIAEFSDPANATAAVDRYKKLTKKNITLEALETGQEIPTIKPSAPETTEAPTVTPKAPVEVPAVEPISAAITEAPPAPPAPVVGYKTAKGSQYQVFPDGTTVRNKAARKDPGHEGDSGLKRRTFKTIYIDPKSVPGGAANLSAVGISGLGPQGARVSLKDGKANLVTWNQKENRWGVAPMQENIPYSTTPAKGLQPLELWDPIDDVPGFESYSNMHAGNEIVEVSEQTTVAGAPVIQEAGAEGIAALPIGSIETPSETTAVAPEPISAAPEEVADVIAVDQAEQEAVRQQLEERNTKVAEGARAVLTKFGLKDVDTKFVPAFKEGLRIRAARGTETRIQGKSLITIATGIYDPDLTTEQLISKVVGTMDHEVIHSLTTLGLLRDTELQMLLDVAGTTKVPGKSFTYLDYAKTVYEPLGKTNPVYRNPEAIREEAVAEMFRDWREKKLGPPPKVRGIINRVFEVLRSMFGAMRSESYETVFKQIESGEVGARPRGSKAQRKNTRTMSETDVRVSVEPELPRLAVSPQYPYAQQVPEVNAAQINDAVSRVEYGAAIDLLINTFNSRTFKMTGLSRIMPGREKLIGFFQNFADKMLPLGLMVDYIKKNGGTVPDALDAFMQEDLMRSKTGDSLQRRTLDLYNPLLDFVRSSGIGLENFELYLYARHAKERNNVIRARNPNAPPEVGSGMSDKDANAILKDVQSADDFDAYRTAEQMFRRIIDDTNSLRVQSGLEPLYSTIMVPDGEGNIITIPAYTNYAPLRGFSEENAIEGEIPEELRARIGQGFKIRGREDKRAMGRTSRASDIVAHAMLQNTEAVIRAAKNQVGLSFLGLIEANPELSAELGVYVMTGDKKPLKRYLSPEGVVKTMIDPMYKNSDDVMVVKQDGKEIPIKINNRFLQKALLAKSGTSFDGADKAISFLQSINRFLGGMRTAWNPEFMLINFPRDLQTAMVALSQYEIEGVKKAILKDSVKSIKSVHQILRNPDAQNEWSQWFEDFRKDGGYINGFYGLMTLEDRVREIEQLTNNPSGSVANRTVTAVKKVAEELENMNGAFENAIRLSVYKNLIKKANVPRQRAAQVAKNLTVNFDKRGSYGPVLNSLYLFYNASVQGNWGLLMAAGRSKKVRQAFGGLFIMGLMQDLVNSLFSNEDEDGRKIYDKIPDYILENNIVLIDPTGFTEKGYFAIPLQYGLNAFYNAGRATARSMRGEYKTSEAATSIGSVAFDAINPIGGTETFLNFMAPTVLDPLIHLSINTDAFGRRISPEPFPGSVPKADSQQFWSSTSPLFKTTADYLNTFTGGTEYVPGMVDFSPTSIEYVWDFLLGGVGSTIRRTYDTATNTIPSALAGDLTNLEMNNVPILRKLVGNVSERMTFEDYFNKVNHVLARGEELKSAIKEGDPERVQSVRTRFAQELRIYPAVRALANQRNKLASELRKVRENAKLPPEQKLRRQDALQKQIENITKRVTKLYEDNVDSGYPSLFS